MCSTLPSETAGSDSQGFESRRYCSRILFLNIIPRPLLTVMLCRILMYTHGFLNVFFSLKLVYSFENYLYYFYTVSLFMFVLDSGETWFIMPQMLVSNHPIEEGGLWVEYACGWSWVEGTVRNEGKCRGFIPFPVLPPAAQEAPPALCRSASAQLQLRYGLLRSPQRLPTDTQACPFQTYFSLCNASFFGLFLRSDP